LLELSKAVTREVPSSQNFRGAQKQNTRPPRDKKTTKETWIT